MRIISGEAALDVCVLWVRWNHAGDFVVVVAVLLHVVVVVVRVFG
jgi:hypothetical protein